MKFSDKLKEALNKKFKKPEWCKFEIAGQLFKNCDCYQEARISKSWRECLENTIEMRCPFDDRKE